MPTMWQNFLLCLRGGNWDTEPAGRSHPSFPFSHSLRVTVAAVAHHGCRRLSPPRLPLALSHMISCFLCGSPPRPPTGARGQAVWGGVATRGETVEASRKTLTGRMAGCPPPQPPTFTPSSSSSSPQLHRQTVKRESSTRFLLPLSLSLSAVLPR